jgi:hypothetical protein
MTQETIPGYDRARRRVERRRRFGADVLGYVVVNAFLVAIWALAGFGYFWPGWVLAGWGVFLILGALDVFYRRDVTDEDVQRELRRGG